MLNHTLHLFIEVLIMKTIKNDFNETVYEFHHKDGLEITYIHKEGFKRSVAAIGTPFGSIHLKQKVNGEIVEHKKGLAHFLEHKLFDDEGQDILAAFSKFGASANAFTSFDQTVYYFSTNLALEEPLKLLLTFVNRFDISEESVEKEKGIIVEELRMYDKMPDMTLLMNTYENVYHNFPIKYDIGGDEPSVNATTLEDLKLAYKLNYNPNKMKMVIISGQNPDTIETIVNSVDINLETQVVEDIFDKEPLTVAKKENEINFPVKTEKMSLSYKFRYDGQDTLKDEFIIRLILALNFTEFNEDYQDWLDREFIGDGFGYDVDLRDGFGVIYFFNEGNNLDGFKIVMDKTIHALEIDKDHFNQIKKRYFGQTILSLSQYDRYALNVLSSKFKKKSYYDYLNDIKNISMSEVLLMKEILHDFDLSINLMKNI